MYEVRIEGMRFHGPHGVFESERATGNDFLARIVATVAGSADRTDRLFDTVDYAGLTELLLDVSESGQFKTIERLAGRYADVAMDRWRKLVALEVTIEKLSPKMKAQVDGCAVSLVRKR